MKRAGNALALVLGAVAAAGVLAGCGASATSTSPGPSAAGYSLGNRCTRKQSGRRHPR